MFNIAIFGRPNVGKSTLFNALVGKKKAIVSNISGVTVDRNYKEVRLNDITFNVIDTAGIFDKMIIEKDDLSVQTIEAVKDSNLIFFVTDYSTGILPMDYELSILLRKSNKDVIHIINKFDIKNKNFSTKDIEKIGFKEVVFVSSEHKQGFNQIYNSLIKNKNLINNAKNLNYVSTGIKNIKVSFIGKPNSGKSSLINSIIGNKRLVTGVKSGLTRDAIEVNFLYKNINYILIDTAGMRKKIKVQDFMERQSVIKSMNAIRDCDVVILVLDATSKLNKQDLTLAKRAIDYGKSIIIALNKWDLILNKIELRKEILNQINISLSQLHDVKLLTTSSLTLIGIEDLLREIKIVFKNSQIRIPTSELNQWFKIILERHPPPMVKGKKNSLKYVSQVDISPPHFLIFCSYPKDLPRTYVKYVTNNLKKVFKFSGVNVKISLKKSQNPFTNRK